MLMTDGPRVLEFNARFGDPETQVLLPRWQDDLAVLLAATAQGRLADLPPFAWSAGAACGVVLAAAGYPDTYQSGQPIAGLAGVDGEALVFHSGTRAGDGACSVLTAGGRVLTVVGRGADLATARAVAYRNATRITFPGRWYRGDIGGTAVGA
jgi:phosphoribosylamine--glycine ligase